MKNTSWIPFCFLLIVASCTSQPPKDSEPQTTNARDTTSNSSVPSEESQAMEEQKKHNPQIIVKRTSDYSQVFLDGLKQFSYDKIELAGDKMILDGEAFEFSDVPEIGKELVFTGRKDDLVIALRVKRINYTTVDYSLEMVEFGKASYDESGQADIASGFFYGSEIDVTKEGEGYMVEEYNGRNGKIQIRIGYEDGRKDLSCKLVKTGNGKIRDIDLDNFPVLIEK